MNAEKHFHDRIATMIARGLTADAVRDGLDLKAASEIDTAVAWDVHPAWTFRLTISPGTYRLRLEQAGDLDGESAPVLRCALSINYYPSPDEPAFKHFSGRERALIEGQLSDPTGMPRADGGDGIPDSLFFVGSMEFIEDAPRDLAYLTYASLDHLRFRRLAQGLSGANPFQRRQGFAAEATGRRLPAWDLGYPLFDALVGLNAFVTRTAPKRVILSRQTGFEFVETAPGRFDCRDAEEPTFKSLLVVLAPEDSGPVSALEKRICAERLTAPWIPVLDCACRRAGGGRGESGHFLQEVKVGDETWAVPLAFNEQWWRLSAAEPAPEPVADDVAYGYH